MSKKPAYIERYKIHGYDTVTGLSTSANDNVFYETFEKAHEKCQQYLTTGGYGNGKNATLFVIFKTYAIVQLERVPTVTYTLAGGKVEEM